MMARGWESKDVEAQLDAAQKERRLKRYARDLTPEEMQAARRRASLELDRIRVLRDLRSVTHPRRRQQLEAALAHIEAELAKIDAAAGSGAVYS